MELITLTLAANESKSLRKAGARIEIFGATGAVSLALYRPNAGIGNRIRFALPGIYLVADFDAFDLTNETALANTVQVLVCDAGEDGGSRNQPGTVTVIDAGKARSQNGQSFHAFQPGGGVAAQTTVVAIENQALSGKRLVIQRLTLVSGATGNAGVAITGVSIGGPTNAIWTKNGGGLSTSLTRFNSIPGTSPNGSPLGWRNIPTANAPIEWTLTDPIILASGNSLVVGGTQVNTFLNAMFEGYEESI